MDIAKLGFEINSAPATKAASDLDKMTAAAGRAESGTEKMARKIEREMSEMNRSVQAATGFIKGFVGAFLSVQGLRAFATLADQAGQLRSRIQLVTGAGEKYLAVQQRIEQVARSSYKSVADISEVFVNSAKPMQQLGMSTQQTLDLMEAFSVGLVVSGANAQASASAIYQFGQAMQTGVLRGQEFNTVLQTNSAFVDALEKSLGKSRAELVAMARDGKLTVKDLAGVASELDNLRESADSMPVTWEDAMTRMRDALMKFFDAVNTESGVLQVLYTYLDLVGDALGLIGPHVAELIGLWAKQDEEQKKVAVSAEQIAYAMKTVVTGIVIAKNTIDVLIDGFKLAGRMAGTLAAAMVDAFTTSFTAFERLVKALTPGSGYSIADAIRDNMADMAGIVDRTMEGLSESTGEFWQDFEKNTADVADAFAFLEKPIREVDAATADLTETTAAFSPVAGKTAEEMIALADAMQKWNDLIGRVAGELDPITKAEEKHNKFVREAQALAAKTIKAGGDEFKIRQQLKIAIGQSAQIRDKEVASINRANAQMERERNVLGRLREEYAQQIALADMTEQQRRAEIVSLQAIADYREKHEGAIDAETEALIRQEAAMGEALLAAKELANVAFEDALGPEALGIFRTIAAIKVLRAELGKASGDEAERIKGQITTLNLSLENDTVGALRKATDAMAGLFEEGSKGQKRAEQATAALAVVQAGLATVDAVRAVLNAAQAPWPLNFGSMAAMAAAVAPLLSAVGAALPAFSGGGGGGTNSAAYRQERQGTGTVLGDETAKSESILNAVEITANATEQLVGINRGMLNALNAMVAGISGASALLARGAGDIDIGPLNTGSSFLGINFGNIFGGKESLRDQGIRIVGGTLSAMIDDIMVQSYASIHRSGGWFRSSRDYDRVTTLGDDVANQFQMVLSSMADAVRAAAEALGLNLDEINARIASFQIEEIRISTMDLSAEEAQKELEAAFSAIFDGLAGHVVPFIDQFQKVGEGLAETLIRVATGVQVTQEAMIQLGFSLDEADPEKFAQASEALMSLAGGVDAFIEGMSSFVSNFATEEHKFAVAQDALTRAFAQAGIEIPATRDAMWDLMQAQDATTESGREVIAMLLRLAGVSDSYYDALEDRAATMAGIDADISAGAWEQYLDGLEEGQRAIVELTRYYDDWIASATEAGATAQQLVAIEEQRAVAMERLLEAAEADYQRMLGDLSDEIDAASMTEYTAAMREINRWTAKTTRELNAAARAAGRQSAAEGDLARVHQVASVRAAQALARLQEQAQALAEELYGTPLSRLEDRIAALQESESAASSAIGGFSDALSDAANAAAEAMGLLLGSYSPLRAVDKLPIAMDALRRGETDADTVLGIARDVYGSGRAYNDIFYEVQRIAAQNAANANQGGGGNTVVAGDTAVSREMQALIAERDALLAEQQAAQRFMQASDLAQMVADLSSARGEGFDVIAESLGFTLEQFAADLQLGGIDDLTDYLTALQAEQLGFAELFDTPTAGDLEIVDAIDGLRDAIYVPEADETAAQERAETLTTLRDVRDALRVIAERGVNANEDAATATERVAEGVERLAVILESDGGPAEAASRRRGE